MTIKPTCKIMEILRKFKTLSYIYIFCRARHRHEVNRQPYRVADFYVHYLELEISISAQGFPSRDN
jgi:hypothetical protein